MFFGAFVIQTVFILYTTIFCFSWRLAKSSDPETTGLIPTSPTHWDPESRQSPAAGLTTTELSGLSPGTWITEKVRKSYDFPKNLLKALHDLIHAVEPHSTKHVFNPTDGNTTPTKQDNGAENEAWGLGGGSQLSSGLQPHTLAVIQTSLGRELQTNPCWGLVCGPL